MRLILGTFAALGIALAAPAAAQSVGMQVVDTAGAPVGTVTAIQGDNLQVKTDKHEVLVPKASFTLNEGKLLFGLTQAQFNAKIEEKLVATSVSQRRKPDEKPRRDRGKKPHKQRKNRRGWTETDVADAEPSRVRGR